MNSSLAYSEVYEILNLLEDEYKNRVPKKVIEFFERERDENYNPIIEIDVPLDKQNLKRETMVLLAILNMNYWCDNADEKQEMLNSFNENEASKKLKEKELAEKYNPNNLFKKNEIHEVIEEVAMVEYKEPNFIQKIIFKIKSLFRRSN